MRIDYRILWIDDTPEWVEPNIDEVEEYLLEFGFVLKYDIVSTYRDIDFSKYDIIAVDCNLSDDEKGVEALKSIREEDIYTEILFYSQHGESKLREEMKMNRIDGVYCSSRENSIEKLKKLILTTIQKTQEINNLRGLVMAETSELDNLLRDILLNMEWTNDVISDSHRILHERCDAKKVSLKDDPPLVDELEIFIYEHFHSSFCFEFLRKFVTDEVWNEIKSYTEEVIEKRNFLAHGTELSSSAEEITIAKVMPDGSEKTLTFTPDDFVKLRRKIKEFRGKFEKISENK